MPSSLNVQEAKKAYDRSWDDAVKAGSEALEALRMSDLIQARDADQAFQEKLQDALQAHERWRRCADDASKSLTAHYSELSKYLGVVSPNEIK